ncbi:hypothetical protein Pla175_43370 [Pirellulimonas nuda]|uniref:Lipoprotein n=1 Tax=Pirellulimonas nuda TaxID=2528009 RepID=A0A518DHH6_9BACT|nr:hypothetical protein [Pirellulimonas nuda]QDU90923.1 hypothetical protein Pla175_43370 [Pirellulimonas nuda]
MKRYLGASVLTVLGATIAGCGGGGLQRFDIQGEVKHNGAPVPSGTVMLGPDHSLGNSGPATIGVIQNGKFKTPSGKGAVAGPHRVVVDGFDGSPPSEMRPFGKPLFPTYETQIDINDSNTELVIDVP